MGVSRIRVNEERRKAGQPQLFSKKAAALRQINRTGLQVIYVNGRAQFWSGKTRVAKEIAEYLMSYYFVLPTSPGLFGEGLAQQYVGRARGPPPAARRLPEAKD